MKVVELVVAVVTIGAAVITANAVVDSAVD